MILTMQLLPDAPALETIDRQMKALTWQDGRATAGATAEQVKHNEQAVMTDAAGQALTQTLLPPFTTNDVLLAAAQPRRFSHFLVSRMGTGGHYGSHVDNALMGVGEGRMRSDLSFTLFLSDPETYEGGELLVYEAGAERRIKGKKGELVLYPSTSIHEVTPVTSGTRIVCVGWIESLVADGAQRELLFDMQNVRASLRAKLPAQAPDLLTLDKSIANLKRMWMQP